MSAIVAAAAAAINALLSPFSPNRDNPINVGNDSEGGYNSEEVQERDDDLPTARRLEMTRTTTTTTTTTSLTVSGQKRKRDGTTHWGGRQEKQRQPWQTTNYVNTSRKASKTWQIVGTKSAAAWMYYNVGRLVFWWVIIWYGLNVSQALNRIVFWQIGTSCEGGEKWAICF